jgi:hypothetical protein
MPKSLRWRKRILDPAARSAPSWWRLVRLINQDFRDVFWVISLVSWRCGVSESKLILLQKPKQVLDLFALISKISLPLSGTPLAQQRAIPYLNLNEIL